MKNRRYKMILFLSLMLACAAVTGCAGGKKDASESTAPTEAVVTDGNTQVMDSTEIPDVEAEFEE